MKRLWRVLFSRITLSLLMIVFEVALLVLLFIFTPRSVYIVVGASLILSFLCFLSLVNRDVNPEYKITWLSLILILPPVGAILYLIFYSRRLSRREGRLYLGIAKELRARGIDGEPLSELYSISTLAAGKARAILSDDPLASVYGGTSSRVFSEGSALFSSMLEDLASAKKFIFLEYFIIDEGELWDGILDMLKRKVSEGVEVRVLYDDFGCFKTLPEDYDEQLRALGINARIVARITPRVSSVHNNRDHRKICVIDGRIAYTGGVNIADEYADLKERFGHWKDGGIRMEGRAVAGFIKLFLATFDVAARVVSDYDRYLSEVSDADEPDGGFYIPFGSGPAPIYRRPVGKNLFLNLINQAEKYLYITTPYLIIDYDLTEALRNAASRGVEVRIVTPGIADKKRIKVMTKSAYPYLMEGGVKIFEYTPGFIHEKMLVSDGKYAVIGTVNFDYRSLAHHYECGVWIFNSKVVEDARLAFLETISSSAEVTRKSSRLTLGEWLVKIRIRLFNPLL